MDTEPAASSNAVPTDAARLAERRWQAVARRDPQADGEFVYAVRATGVYCQSIRHAVVPCALGWVLIAATRKGVCAIEFGEDAQALAERLRTRFPQAQFEPADAEFRRWIARVIAYIEQPQGVLELALDVQGTVFQRRVWQALQAIPAGGTASYAEIVGRIGQPGAARAVGCACASNLVAVAIPCHRAIRADGELSGYRWGVARKAELLRREGKK